MEVLGIVLTILLFVIGMLGTVYPILPGVIAVFAAFFVYGIFISFEPFGLWFWLIQSIILVTLLIADYAVSALGVKKFGGSKASIYGSTIGLIFGPFVISAFGLIIGPFLGAVLGELFIGTNLKRALLIGWGSLVGLFSSIVVKIILQLLMIILFIIWVW